MNIDIKKWAGFHKKEIIIAIIFLIIGLIISPKGTEVKEVVKTEYKNVVKTEYVEECKGFDVYKQIKKVDDEIILTQAVGLMLASEGFMAVADFDFDKLNEVNKQIVNLTPQLEKLSEQRSSLLRKVEQ